jgi:hypothetical protein
MDPPMPIGGGRGLPQQANNPPFAFFSFFFFFFKLIFYYYYFAMCQAQVANLCMWSYFIGFDIVLCLHCHNFY